ncbi:hypothetical protein AG1IA_04889 [Rhizoctonia solani AG-1 IA]|uniref:Uncharacterized protein n=1 Tax=Thanatephorus cucumeris (strain AG1-IA) TaxID=983506 RepID=L8WW77_THACA|nr:hypothetical protein AG1IA_04889 [Rhizoctonia solani AG-1 IA]
MCSPSVRVLFTLTVHVGSLLWGLAPVQAAAKHLCSSTGLWGLPECTRINEMGPGR